MENLIEIVDKWLKSKIDLVPDQIHFSEYTNEEDVSILEINIESEISLGLLLIYGDGFIDVNIHDKTDAEPILVKSYSFNESSEILDVLNKSILKHWK